MKYIPLFFLLGFTLGFSQVKTPQPSPAATIMQTVGLTEFTLTYSRPATRGRAIMGALVPYGEIWRTGANDNTKISFSDPITIKGVTIPAGNYALFTRPGATMWEVFFYTKTDNWGIPQEWNSKHVAASFEFPVVNLNESVASFTIAFQNLGNNGADLAISWDTAKVVVPFTVATVKNTIASIKKTMSDSPKVNDYYRAAGYYLDENLDLKQAKVWIAKAIALEDDKYWMYRQQSLILFRLNEVDAAIASAKKSMELAEKAKNMDYVRLNKKSLEEWSAM